MREIMLMYHPVKKEIHFLVNNNSEYNEIPYLECPRLQRYAPDQGEFLLQNQGNQFFDDIVETFLAIENSKIVFKGTKIDYEDFVKMISDYNKYKEKEILNIGKFIEVPSVDDIYTNILDFYRESMNIFDKKLNDNNTRKIFIKRRNDLNEKIKILDSNNVNLCIVGTYSSGKSTFINAIIGKRILPENINSETAKMFRIQNSKCPSINFTVKKSEKDKGKIASIVWNEKQRIFMFTTDINDDGIKGKIDKIITKNKQLLQHEQLHSIIKIINNLPNSSNIKEDSYIDGIIDINYPIPLCENINFTFFDTPGTDSNSDEHLEILKDALKKQTNSILMILYSPEKMEGTGNSILYKLLEESQEKESNENNVTIDLSRSLHIINQVDRYDQNELMAIRDKKIITTLNSKDELDDNNISKYEYDLKKKRVFYVSSKGAYCAKAKLAGIQNPDDDRFIRRNLDIIVEDKYFEYDNLSEAAMETEELKKNSLRELEKCNGIIDEDEKELKKLFICSGMYAIEEEIVKYAKKYALAVKAKGLYDGVIHVIDGVKDAYEAIESQARSDKEKIREKINIMKNDMLKDINKCYEEFEKYLTTENMEKQIEEMSLMHIKVDNINNRATKEVKKMPRISYNPEKFEEKNKIINANLNNYIRDLDRYYNEKRGKILKRQMDCLKYIISNKIREYKDLEEELLNQILNVSDTEVPPTTLKPIRMEEYINKEKVFLVFTTTNKKQYTREVSEHFISLTTRQYNNYIKEIEDLARKIGKALTDEFITNIETLSGSLEKLINDERKVSEEQRRAKIVLDSVEAKYNELNNKMWRAINE